MDHATIDREGRRLLWRCRRGMKELDIVLERFARARLPGATAEQREVLGRLLELPDPVLAEYLLGNLTPPDCELAELVQQITALPGRRS